MALVNLVNMVSLHIIIVRTMILNTAALALVIILAHRGNNVRHQKK